MGENRKKILPGFLDRPLAKAREAVEDMLDRPKEDEENAARAAAALIRTVFSLAPQDGAHASFSAKLDAFRQIWGKALSSYELDHLSMLLQSAEPVTVPEAVPFLASMTEQEQFTFFSQFVELTEALDAGTPCAGLLKELAAALHIPENVASELKNSAAQRMTKRKKLLRSGAGVLVALIVIGVFILTATLLKSVIFGLMLASLLLPLEQFFERKLRQKNGFFAVLFGGKVDAEGSRGAHSKEQTPISREEGKHRKQKRLTARAVSLTCGVFFLCVVLLGSLLVTFSSGYVGTIRSTVRDWADAARKSVPAAGAIPRSDSQLAASGVPNSAQSAEAPPLIVRLENVLNKHRDQLGALPVVGVWVEDLSKALRNPVEQQRLLRIILGKSEDIFSFFGALLCGIGALLLDLLLTVFFFMLFLAKMAEARAMPADRRGPVRAIFNGSWLPGTSEEVITEADRIVGEVIHKLKVWLRGYLMLMAIDSTVYITVFLLIGVPYAVVLGFIAGCGILLPFLGPIASCLLTLTVTLALEGQAVTFLQLALIVLIYLIHNGITEQFILYPSVIGESLGLTTLETIIVVLLGGIFAGVAGMIFALPAAAVIKYLVPQIYNCWK